MRPSKVAGQPSIALFKADLHQKITPKITPKIKKHDTLIDHPRGRKLCRVETNIRRRLRNQKSGGRNIIPGF
jgi:hypothetical protein